MTSKIIWHNRQSKIYKSLLKCKGLLLLFCTVWKESCTSTNFLAILKWWRGSFPKILDSCFYIILKNIACHFQPIFCWKIWLLDSAANKILASDWFFSCLFVKELVCNHMRVSNFRFPNLTFCNWLPSNGYLHYLHIHYYYVSFEFFLLNPP